MRKERLYILDMMFAIHRAFHAVPPLKAPCGTPVNALHGVLALLRDLWRKEEFGHAVAVFEGAGPSFRQQLDPEYKAHRPPAPWELRVQVTMVRAACEALGLTTIHLDEYEADDVMGTLARWAAERGRGATLVTNDKDLAQVLAFSSEIELLRMGQSGRVERLSATCVEALYGVPPARIADWLALCGDASDNIKGVRGIGRKTAVRLLREHGSLEILLAEPERAGRFAEAFRSDRQRILRDLKLATVRSDLDLGRDGFPEDGYRLRPIEGAEPLFASLGLRGQLRQLRELRTPGATLAELWQSERPLLEGARGAFSC